jgi:hypothetical protein
MDHNCGERAREQADIGFPGRGTTTGNFGFWILDFGVLFQLVLNLTEVNIDSQAKLR